MTSWPVIVTGDTLGCRSCGRLLREYVHVSWGITPRKLEYNLGDEIEWGQYSDGRTWPSFCYEAPVLSKEHRGVNRFNFGSPDIANVVLLDEVDYAGTDVIRCPHCNALIDGYGVRVESGVIRNGVVFMGGELDIIRNPERGIPRHIVEDSDGQLVACWEFEEPDITWPSDS